jgi:hypothetical protein
VIASAPLIGFYEPAPGVAGFVIPVFRSKRSNITLIQAIDEQSIVRGFIEQDFENLDYEIPTARFIARRQRSAIFAFRCLDGSLRVGNRAALGAAMEPIIENGCFDEIPVLRFRLSAFLGLTGRVAGDASAAWQWLSETASSTAADNWKVESTIIPEVYGRVAAALRAAGKTQRRIDRINELLDIRVNGLCVTAIIRVPSDYSRPEDWCELLPDRAAVLGDAVVWWPGLTMASVRVRSVRLTSYYSSSKEEKSIVEEARQFLDDRLFLPALSDTSIPQPVRNIFARTRSRAFQLERIGDLVAYVERFSKHRDDQLKFEIAIPKLSMEHIHGEFIKLFGNHHAQTTTIADLVPMHCYPSAVISAISRIYANRSGGIFPVGQPGAYEAVMVKATISGGQYANKWTIEGEELQYGLQGRLRHGVRVFDEQFKMNRVIINNPGIPIHVFVRNGHRRGNYIYYGRFINEGITRTRGGAKWFKLKRYAS